MGKELLLEIGTEEIPAAFLPKALKDMEEIIRKELAAKPHPPRGDPDHGNAPPALPGRGRGRRTAGRSGDRKAGTGQEGRLRRAGEPLPGRPRLLPEARGSMSPHWRRSTTEKGEYLCARKKITGEATEGLLPAILTKVITDIPFRKSMRWSDLEFRFARPIHWILALYGGRIVPFRIANIESGNIEPRPPFHEPRLLPGRQPGGLPCRDAEPFRHRRSRGTEADHPRGDRQGGGGRRRQGAAER